MTDFDVTGADVTGAIDYLVIEFDRREVTGELGALTAQGILTEAEFEVQKKKILSA